MKISVKTTAHIGLDNREQLESVSNVAFADTGDNGDVWLAVSDYVDNVDDQEPSTRNSIVDEVLSLVCDGNDDLTTLHFYA